VLAEANLKTGDLEAYCDVLTKVASTRRGDHKPVGYEPTIVLGTSGIEKDDVLALSFAGYVLGQVQGKIPTAGHLVTLGGERRRINLQAEYNTVKSIIARLRDWSTDSSVQPPSVVLNKHCPYCPFKVACSALAEAADDLSLLDRMTPKAMGRYHSKGIFTVTQLSFQFKPRRRKRRCNLQRPLNFNVELQALAVRTRKIYIQVLPEIEKTDTALFVDIEGVPDRKFSYLIGLLITDRGSAAQHSFWADSAKDEKSIWQRFVQKVGEYPNAPIYHYGSYEARVIESFIKRFGPNSSSIGKRLDNLNAQVYGRVYFPVRSNSLKVIGKFLGASWTEPDASGLKSLVWRYRWETGGKAEYKEKLISYNAEDCEALRILSEELARLRTNADSQLNVDYVDQPKMNTTSAGSELHAALEQALRFASLNFSDRGWFRTGMYAPKRRGPGAPKGHPAYMRTVPRGRRTVVRVASKRTCPQHKGEQLQRSDKDAEKIIVDLAFGNAGCKKKVIKYLGEKRHCPRCKRYYEPPAIERIRGQTFGHGFRAWGVYQRIILRLPYRIITQAMEELFHETASEASIINFIESFAEDYRRTDSILLRRLRESPFVHVDETRLSICGVDHYVWVFTDGNHVVFRLTEARETAIVQQLLSSYQGVLVSDFYPGYDALPWRQQKCWVHLIGDLNDDLWKFPFDEELQSFVSSVKDLIVPILKDIDRWGLRARYLHKFTKQVDWFYKTVIEGREYVLDATTKYQKRFVRYRDSLFRFLKEDGIPWNNNTAERAIRHLAVQRSISGPLYSRGAIGYLKLLGIAQTCRFQEKSFLKFLLSGEVDVDLFQSGKRLAISREVNRVDPDVCMNPNIRQAVVDLFTRGT
jgi:predicted RecB family nuclease